MKSEMLRKINRNAYVKLGGLQISREKKFKMEEKINCGICQYNFL
jgi:hypothetical protein